jgi:dTMP kinase
VTGRGALIVFEGAEGVGKTTQIALLVARLRELGIPHVAVREPGGTALGDEIRRLLLDPAERIGARAEALLFMASRAQLIDDVVRPALAAGRVVLADRFFLSTYAYQVEGRGLEERAIRATNDFATGGIVPDLTILLDLPVGEGLARAATRGGHDRMERSGDAFHTRVTLAFRDFATAGWQAAHPECGAIHLVDASGDPEEVATRVWRALASLRPETFGVRTGSKLNA